MPTRIDSASHTVLIASPDADSLGAACAMYSHLLRMNKKVTLFCATSPLDPLLAFLPWFAKVTATFPIDADLGIRFTPSQFQESGYSGELMIFDHYPECEALSTTHVLYDWFVAHSIKINGKMANALYAGLLAGTRWFRDSRCTGETFAMAQALIGLGANHAQCVEVLVQSCSLASVRMKSKMLAGMKLLLNGQIAFFEVDDPLLESTGSNRRECKAIIEEALTLKTVKVVLLVITDPQGKVECSLCSERPIAWDAILQPYAHYIIMQADTPTIMISQEEVEKIIERITEVLG